MAVKYVRHDAAGSGDGSTTANSGGTGAWTFAEFLAATPAAGDEIRIMDTGTYSRSATGTVAYANGTAAANIVITGANASGTVDGTRPTIQASAGSITLLNVTGQHIRLDYLIVDGNSQTTTTGLTLGASYTRARLCKVTGCTSKGINLVDSNNQLLALRCEATGCSGTAGFYIGSGGPQARFCEAYANTTHGFQMGNNSFAIGCISSANTGGSTDGFNAASVGYSADRCVAYGNGRDGFNMDGNAGFGSYLSNCAAYGNASEDYGTDGVKAGVFLINCAGRAAGTGYSSTNLTNVTAYGTLTADPFTNAASGDFSPNTTSGGGAVLRAGGFGTFPRGTTVGYADIGVQHQDSGGSPTTVARIVGG